MTDPSPIDCMIAALVAAGNHTPTVAHAARVAEGAVVMRLCHTPTMVLVLRLHGVWHGVMWVDDKDDERVASHT